MVEFTSYRYGEVLRLRRREARFESLGGLSVQKCEEMEW